MSNNCNNNNIDNRLLQYGLSLLLVCLLMIISCPAEFRVSREARNKLKEWEDLVKTDKEIQEMLMGIKKDEKWYCYSQEDWDVSETGNSDFPYIATTEFLFKQPKIITVNQIFTITVVYDELPQHWELMAYTNWLIDIESDDKADNKQLTQWDIFRNRRELHEFYQKYKEMKKEGKIKIEK